MGALIDGHDVAMFDLDGVVYLGPEPVAGAVEGITAVSYTHLDVYKRQVATPSGADT